MADHRICHVDLDLPRGIRWNADIEQERRVAIFDLLENNSFQPVIPLINGHDGPYRLLLSTQENRLLFALMTEDESPVGDFKLPLSPFKRIVRDYFRICESYFDAIKSASPSKIEAIDMGRRGAHNDGATLLMDALKEKVIVDFDTARRLFTLVCVLHLRT